MIPPERVQEIRERTDLIDLVSHYVSLKKAGRNHLGLCPFHAEKTPSFTVNREKGLFHCFGCGAGGDCFGFLMRHDGISFVDAVMRLGEALGMSLEEESPSGLSHSVKERMLEINGLAASHYREMLFDAGVGVRARAYLRQRGLKRAAVEKFDIGFAPPDGESLVKFLAGRGLPIGDAVSLGIVHRNAQGKVLDLMRDRIIFPIQNESGKVVGFGGRALGSNGPKYLNTPSSPVYNKGESLYGLRQARESFRRHERAILVEGYVDVIMVSQAGVEEVVGSLGTSVTVHHLRKLSRLVPRVVAMFDGDEAGEKAALRSFELFLEGGCSGEVCVLPRGEDPDSFSRHFGLQGLEELLGRSVPLLDFYLSRIKKRSESPKARSESFQELARLIAKIQDPVERDFVIQKSADAFGMREELLRSQLQKRPHLPSSTPSLPAENGGPSFRAERAIVEWMLRCPRLIPKVEASSILSLFENPEWKDVGLKLTQTGRVASMETEQLLSVLPEEVQQTVSRLLMIDENLDRSPESYVDDCIKKLRILDLERREASLRSLLKEAEKEGSPRVNEFLREWTQLKTEQRNLMQRG